MTTTTTIFQLGRIPKRSLSEQPIQQGVASTIRPYTTTSPSSQVVPSPSIYPVKLTAQSYSSTPAPPAYQQHGTRPTLAEQKVRLSRTPLMVEKHGKITRTTQSSVNHQEIGTSLAGAIHTSSRGQRWTKSSTRPSLTFMPFLALASAKSVRVCLCTKLKPPISRTGPLWARCGNQRRIPLWVVSRKPDPTDSTSSCPTSSLLAIATSSAWVQREAT